MTRRPRRGQLAWPDGILGVLGCIVVAIGAVGVEIVLAGLQIANEHGHFDDQHFVVTNAHDEPLRDVRLIARRSEDESRVLATFPSVAPGETVRFEFERKPGFVLDVAFRGPDGPERRSNLDYIDSDELGDRSIWLAPADQDR